jgi:hypothetical protein
LRARQLFPASEHADKLLSEEVPSTFQPGSIAAKLGG